MRNEKATILVVDDEHLLRWTLVTKLSSNGFAVMESDTVGRVFEYPVDRFDLVLLDFRLPDGTGLDVLRRLRADGFTKSVIMMSAFAGSDITEAAASLGADDFIVKPFDVDALISRVSGILASPRN